jgi:hypothetical protein
MSLVSWLDRRITRRRQARRAPAGKATSPFRPQLEALEGRDLLSFSAPVSYPEPQPAAMVAADVNGDGKPDLLTLGTPVNNNPANGEETVSVRLNNGNGTFGPDGLHFVSGLSAVAMVVGDVNGDGNPDIVLANARGPDQWSPDVSVTVMRGDGHGNFFNDNQSPLSILPDTATSIALADVDGDGKMDLVAMPATGGEVYVARNLGNCVFDSAQTYRVPEGGNPLVCGFY